MKKILIIQTAFLGDVVLATSLAESLHRKFPQAEISFLLRKGNEGVLHGHPFVQNVLIWDKRNRKYRNLFRLLRVIRGHHYDLVVNCQRFAASGFLTGFSGAREKSGFRKNPFSLFFHQKAEHRIGTAGETVHEIQRNQLLISGHCGPEPELPKLYPSPEEEAAVSGYKTKPYCCLAPASVWFTKQLPREKWIALINGLDRRFQLYLIGSPQDFALCEDIKNAVPDAMTENLCGKTTLLQTASLMRDARMNYVNDSAPLHLASAVNAPVTVFFCSTVPAFGFGPLRQNGVTAEVQSALHCRPCGLHGKTSCPEKHFRCGFDMNLSPFIIPYA